MQATFTLLELLFTSSSQKLCKINVFIYALEINKAWLWAWYNCRYTFFNIAKFDLCIWNLNYKYYCLPLFMLTSLNLYYFSNFIALLSIWGFFLKYIFFVNFRYEKRLGLGRKKKSEDFWKNLALNNLLLKFTFILTRLKSQTKI